MLKNYIHFVLVYQRPKLVCSEKKYDSKQPYLKTTFMEYFVNYSTQQPQFFNVTIHLLDTSSYFLKTLYRWQVFHTHSNSNSHMGNHVFFLGSTLIESFETNLTAVRFSSCVNSHMSYKIRFVVECLWAKLTHRQLWNYFLRSGTFLSFPPSFFKASILTF